MNEADKLASAVDTLNAAGPLGAVLVVFGVAFFWMMRIVFKDLSQLIREQTKTLKGLQAEIRSSTDELKTEIYASRSEASQEARSNGEKLTTLMERTNHVART